MGWLDFFRKKKEIIAEPAQEKEQLSVQDVREKLDRERQNLEKKADSIKKEIEKHVKELLLELEEKKEPLKSVSLDDRKEPEKIKVIVKENLFFYSSHLERFIAAMDKIDVDRELKSYILEIQSVLNNFNKQSFKNFEKATILVGKELEEIKESFSRFTSSFNSIISENKSLFDALELISLLLPKFQDLDELGKNKEKIDSSLSLLEKKRVDCEANLASLQEEYSHFKGSQEFKKLMLEKDKIMEEINRLKKDSLLVKEESAIKELQKHYHHDIKKRNLLSLYQEKFMTALEEDENLELAKMSLESRGHDIKAKLIDLKEKNKKLKEMLKEKPEERKMIIFEEKMKDFMADMKNLEGQISEENKKKEKLSEKEAELLSHIKSNSQKLFGDIELIR